MLRGAVARALIVSLLTSVISASVLAQADELERARREVEQLSKTGKYAEAIPVAERALELTERKYGPRHAEVGRALNTLALLNGNQGRYAEAEKAYRRGLVIAEESFGPNHQNVIAMVSNLAGLYTKLGRFDDAEQFFKRALTTAEKGGQSNSVDYAKVLSGLAGLYQERGRYVDAEPLFKRSLAIREKLLKSNDPAIAIGLNNLGNLYQKLGRYGEAEPLLKRALLVTTAAQGEDHPDVAYRLGNLAGLYDAQGRFAEAEPLFKRALAIREKMLGPDHPDLATSLNNLAEQYRRQGRYADAEPLHRRALSIREKALPAGHPDIAQSLGELARIYQTQGRLAEAQPLLRRALEIREKTLPSGHTDIANTLTTLAVLYEDQRRFAEAEPLLQRALAIYEKALPAGHPTIAISLNNLAFLYDNQGRYGESEPLHKRALAIRESSLPPAHPDIAVSLNNLAWLYGKQGRTSEEEALYTRALALREKALPAGHPLTVLSLTNVAGVYQKRQDWQTAYNLLARATDYQIARVKRDRETALRRPNNDASQGAGEFNAFIKVAHQLEGKAKIDRSQLAAQTFERIQWVIGSEAAASLAQMVARGARGDPALANLVRERQDLAGEWNAGDKVLVSAAALTAERRDITAEKSLRDRLASIDARLSEIDRSLSKDFPDYAALSQPEPASIATVQAQLHPDEALILIADTWEAVGIPEETFLWVVTKADSRWIRSGLGEKLSREHVAALRCGLDDSAWAPEAEVSCRGLLRSEFSSQDIGAGKPLPFDLARAHALYEGLFEQIEDLVKDKHLLLVPSGLLTQLPFQVLVTSLPNAEDTGLKARVVGKLGAEFNALTPNDRMRLHAPAAQGVRILRAQPGSPAESIGIKPDDVLLAVGTVPTTGVGQAIDAIRAYAPETLVPFKLLREGKELELSAKLEALTIQQWVPRFLDLASARQVRWLARDHALTVLPAVSSLIALRRIAKPSGASKQVIGFGNPLLDGYQDHPQFGAYYKELAERARALRGCATDNKPRTASAMRGGIKPIAARGGLANLSEIKEQSPLPETADELCVVARALGGDLNDVRLGARATEGEVKALSRGGQLARYRVIHFATHGTLAGDVDGTTEPGLILTPPSRPTEEDDGYLSASEIAGLKLDADWVILSACNTAAANSKATGAQALSGVARAFFYAQARALLVSHWPVKSDATVKLITDAVSETARGAKIGRAEALRHAMLQLIDNGAQAEAHPSYWAPFVVVGEGSF